MNSPPLPLFLRKPHDEQHLEDSWRTLPSRLHGPGWIQALQTVLSHTGVTGALAAPSFPQSIHLASLKSPDREPSPA